MSKASTVVAKGRALADKIEDPIIAKQLRNICDTIETYDPLFHDNQ